MNERIYLDYNATTPYSEKLKQNWMSLLELFGNPSSIHHESRAPKTIVRETRIKISQLLKCSPIEIIFNSGASEGNSSIFNLLRDEALKNQRNEVIISAIEHPSVRKAAYNLKNYGFKIFEIPVSLHGEFDLNYFASVLSQRTALVSVMFANNETGVILPVQKISQMAREAGALMHSDCVQMIGKTDFDFSKLNLDYATFSAHKLYSVKGLGFMYVKKNSPWTNLIFGGGQERARRGGTENILSLAAFHLVVDDYFNCLPVITEMAILRDEMEEMIQQKIPAVKFTHQKAARLANTSSLVIEEVDGETLLMSLDLKGFAVSTGAACSSGNPEPSPVLLAIGLSREEAQNSLRISLGVRTTKEEVVKFIDTLVFVVEKLRRINAEEKSGYHVS